MQKTVRIDLRASDEDKQTIAEAAQLRRVSLSEFILAASRAAAEEVLAEQSRFRLSPTQLKKLNQALDAPPREIPGLRDLFSRPDPFSR